MNLSLRICFSILLIIQCTLSFSAENQDALEKVNRQVYNFNHSFDKVFVDPSVKVYKTIVPWPARKGVTNAYRNINTIPTILNDILQAKFPFAIYDTGRMILNTTFGIGGLFDFATRVGLPPHYEDFGMTLATYGYAHSNYLLLPVIGPMNIRDSLGLAADYYIFSPYTYVHSFAARAGIVSLFYINTRTNYQEAQKLITDAAFDPYAFQRESYFQYRENLMKENQISVHEFVAEHHFKHRADDSDE